MHAPTEDTAPPAIRSQESSAQVMGLPPPPWLDRRFAVGAWLVTLGVLLLSYGRWWAAWLLVAAALVFWVGHLDMTVARSAAPRT